MHKHTFCHKLFEKALPKSIHKKRRSCLTRFVSSLLNYSHRLSVTEIGKHLQSNTTLKHNIKAANYFANNQGLCNDIPNVYQGLAQQFFGGYRELTVLVDYSGACSAGYMSLTASVACHGRSIPVYQEIYSEKDQEQASTHETFLFNLQKILPKNTKVTVITDAGFRREWFEKIIALGWDYIGRIYSSYQYQREGSHTWERVAGMSFAAYGKASAIGAVSLGKTKTSVQGYLYTYRQKPCEKPHKRNKFLANERDHSNAFRKGWVIFSSLDYPANKLIRYYKQRMQVEQNFRDIKSQVFGVGLRANQSRGLTRCRMLYFIATILTIVLWWIGLMIEAAKEHRQYQANTIKDKRVRSFVHLARLKLLRDNAQLRWSQFTEVIDKLRLQYANFCETGELQ